MVTPRAPSQPLLPWIIIVAICSSFASSSSQSQVINPSCQFKCGNISVPYPFGMSQGCYWSEDKNFFIRCDETDPAAPVAFLRNSSVEVRSISVDGELSIYTKVSRDCYNSTGAKNFTASYAYEFPIISFPFSSKHNKFTAIGCDTTARFSAGPFSAGCSSGCYGYQTDLRNVVNGSCSGLGCCQSSIPIGLTFYEVVMSSLTGYRYSHDNFTCGYSFLADERSFNFSVEDLKDVRGRTTFPTVLDWSVGTVTCQEAVKNSSNYICRERSQCVDALNGPGYRCECVNGYQGNPYLTNGCQDTNECLDETLNRCLNPKRCVNTQGSYTCSCPSGYKGDGRKGGTGCLPDRSLVIKIAVGASIGGVAVFFLLCWLGYWLYKVLKKRRIAMSKKQFFERNGGLLLRQQTTHYEDSVERIKIFTSDELEKATDNFNSDRVLGQGGQGTVYKGMLTDGMIVAVKKSKIVDESQLEPFINEVVILSQINHRNVVRLLGCCLETEVPLLIYEHIPNGSLFQLIHHNDGDLILSWRTRLQIATEVASALAYLHSATSVPVYHRDIKSGNILLDGKYRAKVCDFGTSRTISIDQTHLTTAVQGTFGYLDPEYFQTSQFTEKSDVYSFGVVVVELLTSRKAVSSDRSLEERSLATFFLSSLEEGRLLDLIDPLVKEEAAEKEIMAVAGIAKQCLNLSGKKRPNMKEVMVELEGIRMAHMPVAPNKPPQQAQVTVRIPLLVDDTSYTGPPFTDTDTAPYQSDVHPLLLR
uniref:Uncharacterized protein n=1 Tax=Kalanchoe fedtschenkoi TaxID=63787 RepID=A0A7N0UMC6_KALFE